MEDLSKEFIQKQIDNNKKQIIENMTIIIAPHTDDEIIGCYDIIKNKKPIIIYAGDIDNDRRKESLKLKEHIDIGMQLFLNSIPQHFLNKNNIFYFPDPIYETHPKHRLWGNIGEQIARSGMNVIFYSTNMTAPYIHEIQKPNEKEELLNKVYPSQKDLWKYEKKYILFEGYCKWIF